MPSNKKKRTEREVEDIEERSTPSTPVIYEIVAVSARKRWRGRRSRCGGRRGRRPVDQLFAVGAGHPATHLPDTPWRPLVSQSWLFGRLRHGGAVAPAALHREDDHRRIAGHGRVHPGNMWKLARCGPSCSWPISPAHCSRRCSVRSPRCSRRSSRTGCWRSAAAHDIRPGSKWCSRELRRVF